MPRFRFGETTRQAGMLFSAQTISMVAGLVISIIQARWMEPSEMGRFAFCLSLIVVGGLLFEFGIASAGARVLALSRDDQTEREALGALTLITLAISIAFSLFIAAVAVPVDLIFNKDVRWLLVALGPLAFFQPFQLFIEQVCQGMNRIRRLSVFQLLIAGINLIALIALVAMHRLTAGSALGAYLAAVAVATLWTIARLRPSFQNTTNHFKVIFKETRGYGLNMYFARVMGMISSRADQLVIAYFIAASAPLGIYAIAQKFSNPISMVGRSLAVTRFRAFAKLASVPRRITHWNAGLLVAASVGLIIAGPFAIKLLFPQYTEGISLLVPFALMNLLTGLFQPYNVFLGAHGRGVELRNIVFIVSLTSVVGLFLAVPRFGIAGAAWVGAAAMALDYLLHLHYYSKFRRALKNSGFVVHGSEQH